MSCRIFEANRKLNLPLPIKVSLEVLQAIASVGATSGADVALGTAWHDPDAPTG